MLSVWRSGLIAIILVIFILKVKRNGGIDTTIYGKVKKFTEEENKNVKYCLESFGKEVWVVDIEPQLLIKEGDTLRIRVEREKNIYIDNQQIYIITSEDIFEVNGEHVWEG